MITKANGIIIHSDISKIPKKPFRLTILNCEYNINENPANS